MRPTIKDSVHTLATAAYRCGYLLTPASTTTGTSPSTGGLFSRLKNRRSAEIRYDHLTLRLVPGTADTSTKDPATVTVADAGAGAGTSGITLHLSGPGGAVLPDFDIAHDYAAWASKNFASDADKEASKRCWNHLKYTRVLDIVGTAARPPTRTPPRASGGADQLFTAEVLDALNPAAPDLHDAPRAIDSDDPLVLQLRWLCDALQNLEVVRYIGFPYSEAFVKLFADVERKIVFPRAPADAPPPLKTAYAPEVAPGASTRIVTHVDYAPALGPTRVPIQYDYATAQDMIYVYLFNSTGAGAAGGDAVGLEHDSWRRLIREIGGILTYFQDMPPEIRIVDFPLPAGDVVAPSPVAEERTDAAALTTVESRAQAAIASDAVASAAGVAGIEGTSVSGPSDAPGPDAQAELSRIPPTKAAFLAALAQRITLNQNNPDHLKEMLGTGSPEGQVQDALSRITFLSLDEYRGMLDVKTEFELETKI